MERPRGTGGGRATHCAEPFAPAGPSPADAVRRPAPSGSLADVAYGGPQPAGVRGEPPGRRAPDSERPGRVHLERDSPQPPPAARPADAPGVDPTRATVAPPAGDRSGACACARPRTPAELVPANVLRARGGWVRRPPGGAVAAGTGPWGGAAAAEDATWHAAPGCHVGVCESSDPSGDAGAARAGLGLVGFGVRLGVGVGLCVWEGRGWAEGCPPRAGGLESEEPFADAAARVGVKKGLKKGCGFVAEFVATRSSIGGPLGSLLYIYYSRKFKDSKCKRRG